MNLRFVEAFYWAVTLKSVTRAAEKLCVTQSALSNRLATLESELGVLLLDRRDKQLRLTSAGVRFQKHAERLLHLQREIKDELGRSESVAHPMTLRVGVIESVLHSWLIEWVRHLRQQHAGFELELTVETSPVLVEQMRRGTVDLIMAARPADGSGVRSRPLAAMPMVFVGPCARFQPHPIELKQLAAEVDLLTFQRGSQPHVALLDLLRKLNIDARVHTISSISAMVELIEAGFGVATLPQAAVARLADRRELAALPCSVALMPLPIHLSWRDDPVASTVGSVVDSAITFGNPQQP